MVGCSAKWRGSRAARQVARGEAGGRTIPESTREEKYVALWEGAGLGEKTKSCFTQGAQNPLPAGAFRPLSGPVRNYWY